MKKISSIIVLIFILFITIYAEDDYHFAVLSDRLGGGDHEAFEIVLKDIERLQPDFVVTVGDLTESYRGPEFQKEDWKVVKESLKILTCPIYHTPGNHDIIAEEYRAYYEQQSGFKSYYSFDYGDSHFIIFDNAIGESYAEIKPEQKKWLEEDLKTNQHKTNIFVFMHKPFWANGIGKGKPDEMHELFKKYNVDAVFTGHWHQYASNVYDGITYVLAGSSGGGFGSNNKENIALGMFFQFLWCKVEGDKLHVSIIKSGNTFDRDLVTIQEEMLSWEIMTKHIIAEINYNETGDTKTGDATVYIKNINDYSLESEIIWEFEENWEITPRTKKVRIKKGKATTEKFEVNVKGSIYPLPVANIKYPFGDGKYVENINTAFVKKNFVVKKGIKPPVIDGEINFTSEWTQGYIKSFSNYYGEAYKIDDTKVYFMCDKENLYFGAECFDRNMKKLKESLTKRDDPIYEDDCIGMLIEFDKNTIYQFYVNPKGVIWDQKIDIETQKGDMEFNADIEVKTKKLKDRWNVELKIPLKDINAENKEELRVNIRRKQQRLNDGALWVMSWDYNTSKYGVLIFK